jgi:hypothetical protein
MAAKSQKTIQVNFSVEKAMPKVEQALRNMGSSVSQVDLSKESFSPEGV